MVINLDGLIVSMLTPMNEDYNIDFFGLKNLTARLMNKGVQNFVILSENSEYAFFDYSFQKKIVVGVSKEIGVRGNLIVGCFSDSTDEIIEKVRFAEKYSNYCLVNVPFNALTNEVDFIDFFDNLFTKTKANIILYNNPFLFKKNIPIFGLNKIVGWEKLIGIIDCSKNKSYFKMLCDYHQLLKIFQGYEVFAVESFNFNCSGIVSGLSNVFPELFLNIKKNFKLFGYDSLLRQEIFLLNMLGKISLGKEVQSYKKMLAIEGIIQEYFSDELKKLSKDEIIYLENILKKSIV
ncbi:MAG: dihydrodipicolinate synthase family protein [Candidatus ainarchaeum sp.]|nr:dihydrodipicolinate synthase family protein [Candidatus ainarchaeum sp.]